MKTILNPHIPTSVEYDYSSESPMSTCEKCEKTIHQFTWYDDDCGWRTDKAWHYLTWRDGRSQGVKVGVHNYECEVA